LSAGLCAAASAAVAAPVETVIYDFSDSLYATGAGPSSGLVVGKSGNGKAPWTYTLLFQFTDGANGSNPYGGLAFDKNRALYGTTYYGAIAPNTDGYDTVFKLANTATGPTGWTFATLYTFTGVNDGGNPDYTLLLDSKGNIFGVATRGGAVGTGAIFRDRAMMQVFPHCLSKPSMVKPTLLVTQQSISASNRVGGLQSTNPVHAN